MIQLKFSPIRNYSNTFKYNAGIVLREKDGIQVVVKAYFTIKKDPNSKVVDLLEATFTAGTSYIEYIKVGFDLIFKKLNKEEHYKTQKHNKGAMKKYTLNSGVLINLNKIVTQIKREIIGKDIRYNYIVNIDLSKDYLNISKEDFNVENLNDFLNNLNDLDLLELNEIKSRKKLLKSFREELGSKLNQNESVLEDIFNKYQSLLPLILKGVDATLDFQYSISSEGRNMIADANMTEDSGKVNIIELKKATDKFFTPSNSN